jgi:hypothetical protein
MTYTAQPKYPLVICYIAIENGHLLWIYPLKMVIFHSYVKLPEGKHSKKIREPCFGSIFKHRFQSPWFIINFLAV